MNTHGITRPRALVRTLMRSARRAMALLSIAACAAAPQRAPAITRAAPAAPTAVAPVAPVAPAAPERPRCVPVTVPHLEAPEGALRPWYAALDESDAVPGRRAVWMLLGDSHVEDGALARRIRARLVERHRDGGRGMLPPAMVRHFRARDVTLTARGAWTVARGFDTPMVGITGLRARTSEEGASLALTLPEEFDAVEVLHRAGEGAWLSVGDARLLHGEVRLPSPSRTITLRHNGMGDISLDAIAVSRRAGGVVVDAAGVVGARATHRQRWDPAALNAALAWRRPALVTLVYGTNDAADPRFDAARFADALGSLIDLARGQGAAVLVLGAPDFALRDRAARRYVPPPALDAVIDAQRRVARARGAAFFDARAWMGGPGAMEAFVASRPPRAWGDHVHLTERGYEALADALVDALDAHRGCAGP